MRIKIWFKYPLISAILLMLLLAACNNDGLQIVSKPTNLVSKQKMASVLVDLHIIEAGLSGKNLPPDSLKRVNAGYYNYILNKNELDAPAFESSYTYYLSVPAEMDTIYTYVVDELSNRELKLKTIAPLPDSDTTPKIIQSVTVNP